MLVDEKRFRVLVLCTGNICRSPVAEAMLAAKLCEVKGVLVTSAGVAAPIGVAPDPKALQSAVELGYEVSPQKRSRQVSTSDLEAASVILVMENDHKQYIRRRSPINANKTFLLGQWTCGQIGDPIGQSMGVFSEVAALMESATTSWVGKIKNIATA